MTRFIIICTILIGSLKSYGQQNNQIDDFFDLGKGDTLFIDVYQECSRALGEGYRYLVFKENEISESLTFIYIEGFGQTYFLDGKELSRKEKLALFLSYDSEQVRSGTINFEQLTSIKTQLEEIIETNNNCGGFSYHCSNFLELSLNNQYFKKQFEYQIRELKLKN